MNTEQAEAPLDGDPSECLYHASLSPRGRDSASPWRILTGLLARHVLGSPRIRAADVERINQVLAPNLQEYTSSTFSLIVARPKSVTRLYIRGQAVAGFVWFPNFTRSHRLPHHLSWMQPSVGLLFALGLLACLTVNAGPHVRRDDVSIQNAEDAIALKYAFHTPLFAMVADHHSVTVPGSRPSLQRLLAKRMK